MTTSDPAPDHERDQDRDDLRAPEHADDAERPDETGETGETGAAASPTAADPETGLRGDEPEVSRDERDLVGNDDAVAATKPADGDQPA